MPLHQGARRRPQDGLQPSNGISISFLVPGGMENPVPMPCKMCCACLFSHRVFRPTRKEPMLLPAPDRPTFGTQVLICLCSYRALNFFHRTFQFANAKICGMNTMAGSQLGAGTASGPVLSWSECAYRGPPHRVMCIYQITQKLAHLPLTPCALQKGCCRQHNILHGIPRLHACHMWSV